MGLCGCPSSKMQSAPTASSLCGPRRPTSKRPRRSGMKNTLKTRKLFVWLSKLWSPFGSLKYLVPYYTKDPQKGSILLTTTHFSMQWFAGRQTRHDAEAATPACRNRPRPCQEDPSTPAFLSYDGSDVCNLGPHGM